MLTVEAMARDVTADWPDPALDPRTRVDNHRMRRRSAMHTAALAARGVRFDPEPKSRVADSEFPDVKRLHLYWPDAVSNSIVS